jgi:hypothetical protein
MKTSIVHRVCAVVLLAAFPAALGAQYGHPMKGQWSGQWGKDEQRLLLDLNWDGKEISGVINPGANGTMIKTATIDYTDTRAGKWTVKLVAEGKDASGKPVTIEADGVLENIGSNYRVYHGTWTQNGVKGEFTVTRN